MSRSQRRTERGAQSWRRSSSSTAPWMRVHAYCSSVAPLARVVAVDRDDQRLQAAGDEVLDLRVGRHLADLAVDDVLDHRREGEHQPVAQPGVVGLRGTRLQSARLSSADILRVVVLIRGNSCGAGRGRLEVSGRRRTVRIPISGETGIGHASTLVPPQFWGSGRRRAPGASSAGRRPIDEGARSPERPRGFPRMALRLTDPVSSSAPAGAAPVPALAPAVALRARAAAPAGRRRRGRLPRAVRRGGAASTTSTAATRRACACWRPACTPRAPPPRSSRPSSWPSPRRRSRCWRTSRASRSLLNAAGVACYELGELAAAERLFQATRGLDPQLPHLAANLAEIAPPPRRRAGRPPEPARRRVGPPQGAARPRPSASPPGPSPPPG